MESADILKEFKSRGVSINNKAEDIVNMLLAMCSNFGLQPSELADQWESFSMEPPSMSLLNKLNEKMISQVILIT